MDRVAQRRARRAITRPGAIWVNPWPGIHTNPATKALARSSTLFIKLQSNSHILSPLTSTEASPIKPQALITLLLSALITACSQTATVEKSWVKPDIHTKDLHGVLVYTAATSESGRRAFEREFTQALQDQGVHAVASHTLKGGTEITKEEIAAMAAKAEVDTVLVTLFAGRDENAVLHPGRKYYGYAPVYGSGYYGRGRVYGVPYQVGQTSDFWSEHKSIHLTAILYEIKTEERLWQVNSGMEESEDVAGMRSAFIKSFMQDLADQGKVD